MAGVSPNPDRELFLETVRKITIAGGKAMTMKHVGASVDYPAAISDDARALAAKDAFTCGCGDHRMVTLAYQNEVETPDGELIKQEKRYIACVNCDAVHLQPRYLHGA